MAAGRAAARRCCPPRLACCPPGRCWLHRCRLPAACREDNQAGEWQCIVCTASKQCCMLHLASCPACPTPHQLLLLVALRPPSKLPQLCRFANCCCRLLWWGAAGRHGHCLAAEDRRHGRPSQRRWRWRRCITATALRSSAHSSSLGCVQRRLLMPGGPLSAARRLLSRARARKPRAGSHPRCRGA